MERKRTGSIRSGVSIGMRESGKDGDLNADPPLSDGFDEDDGSNGGTFVAPVDSPAMPRSEQKALKDGSALHDDSPKVSIKKSLKASEISK